MVLKAPEVFIEVTRIVAIINDCCFFFFYCFYIHSQIFLLQFLVTAKPKNLLETHHQSS